MPAINTALVENEAEFRMRCREELLQAGPGAATWADAHCVSKWKRAEHSSAMAEAILMLASEDDIALSRDEARAHLQMVRWSSDGNGGMLHDLRVDMSPAGREISFHWQQQGSEPPYNLIDALRVRGVKLRTLGCPQYPGASMGQEIVMHATPADGSPFTFTVYSRPAPTGIEAGLYIVDVDFNDIAPDVIALQQGRYPGGGGRAFAVEPAGWEHECPDPE